MMSSTHGTSPARSPLAEARALQRCWYADGSFRRHDRRGPIMVVCESWRRLGGDPLPGLVALEEWLAAGDRVCREVGLTRRTLQGRMVLAAVMVLGGRWGLQFLSPDVDAGSDRWALLIGAGLWGSAHVVLQRFLHRLAWNPVAPEVWLQGWYRPLSVPERSGRDPRRFHRIAMERRMESQWRQARERLEALRNWLPLWEIWAYWGPAALWLLGPALGAAGRA